MRVWSLVVLLGCLGAAQVEVGWGGHYRAGRFAPVFVTVAADEPTAGVVEVFVPGTGPFGERVETPVTLGPKPATYRLLVRPSAAAGEITVTVRDQDGRTLAVVPDRAAGDDGLAAEAVLGGRLLVAVGGRVPAGLDVADAPQAVGALPAARLPAVPLGYDAADVLVLDRPDWARWDPRQRRALADWVGGGGRLVLATGAGPVPADVAGVLPGPVGALRPDGTRPVEGPTVRVGGRTIVAAGGGAVGVAVLDSDAGALTPADWSALFDAIGVTAAEPRPEPAPPPASKLGWRLPLLGLLGVCLLLGPGEMLLLGLRGRRIWHPVPVLATAGLLAAAAAVLTHGPAVPAGGGGGGEGGWVYGAADGRDLRLRQGPAGNVALSPGSLADAE